MNTSKRFGRGGECPAFERTESAELHTITGHYYRNGLPAVERQYSQGWFDMSEKELEAVEREQQLEAVELFETRLYEAAKSAFLCSNDNEYFNWIFRKAFGNETFEDEIDESINLPLAKRMFDVMPNKQKTEFLDYAAYISYRPDQFLFLFLK